MILQDCVIPVNDQSQELKPHGNAAFPCAGYAPHYRQEDGDNVPWHWHDELEVIYIEKADDGQGPVPDLFPETRRHLGHQWQYPALRRSRPGMRPALLRLQPALVTGSGDSAMAEKYIRPLLTCSFSAFYSDSDFDDTMARYFRTAFTALAQESFGFEFTVREALSQICLFLYGRLQPGTTAEAVPSLDEERIKKMLTYIHGHFDEPITVSDIAGAAAISQRECLRCFQKTIQLSPIQYVLKYRIMQGADQLVKEPSKSITAIAAACGFDSQSHFAKTFKHFYANTPRQYRKSHVSTPIKEAVFSI